MFLKSQELIHIYVLTGESEILGGNPALLSFLKHFLYLQECVLLLSLLMMMVMMMLWTQAKNNLLNCTFKTCRTCVLIYDIADKYTQYSTTVLLRMIQHIIFKCAL